MSPERLALLLPAFARAGSYVCVFVLVGAATLRMGLAPVLRQRSCADAALRSVALETRRWGIGAAIGLIAFRVVQLYGQAYAIFGLDEPVTLELMRLIANSTTWGTGWWIQTAAAMAALAAVVFDRGRRPARAVAGGVFVAVAAAFTVCTVPLTGHAMERPGLSWPLLFQIVHVSGAALWIGSLAMLATIGARACSLLAPEDRAPGFAALVDRFSRLALAGFAALALAGAASSVVYVGRLGRLLSTTYGRALLLKLAFVLATGLIGAYNWRRIRPRLADQGADALHRSATSELLLALLVLAVTALLVALPMPGG